MTLVVAHGLFITWGTPSRHRPMSWSRGDLVLTYPDVLMATVAGLLSAGNPVPRYQMQALSRVSSSGLVQ